MPTWLDKILNSQFVMIGLAGLAFLIALWLVIVIARMLMGGRLRLSGARTRQARLGIVDAFDLDRQRQLIIVRRDNTEHLIMIGGPNDLVIESEIVRVEARELRRSAEKPDSHGDNRIPAPIAVPEMPAPGSLPEEPLLPMPLPQTTVSAQDAHPASDAMPVSVAAPEAQLVSPPPQRTPTFPLPPRRPIQPERRPPPPPESVSRTEEPMPSPAPDLPPAVVPASAVVPPMVEQPELAAPAPPVSAPAPAPRPLPPRAAPPSFLKPLPPRPPIRPLRRATPVVPGGAPAGASPEAPQAAAPASAPPAPPAVEPDMQPVPAPAVQAPAAPAPTPVPPAHEAPQPAPEAPKAGEQNALESLEEEMAKLLGRG